MARTMIAKALMVVFIFSTMIIFSACAADAGSIGVKWGNDNGSEQHKVKQKHKGNGPPAHAPAHGYRAKHQYRYYPARRVYHDASRGLYFYLKGDNWEVGVSLPGGLKAELGESVRIELQTDEPYRHNVEHMKQHPPWKYKGKKNKKASKKK